MTRPKIAPDLAAALIAAVPARLAKKLDATPALAEAWTWTADAVTTDKGEVVRLAIEGRGEGSIVTGAACSCLLSPRCLHVAAVVAVLEPADVADDEPADAAIDPAPASAPAPALSPSRADAAAEAFRVLADILATGAEASGAFAQAQLLRSIHACRSEGLHRLAAAQTRTLRSIRELRSDRPEFALASLTADLRDALAISHALSSGESSPSLLGTARRDYEPIGNLRLHGVFTEAVLTRSGYAGAITYLMSDRGALYSRGDVAPGDAGRAAGAYEASVHLGDASMPHRELCRSGLFVSDATASADGRLGAGQRVRAVRASEPSRWDVDPIAARFRVPLADQLMQIAARDGVADEQHPAGWDLAFVEGTVAAIPGGVGLLVARDGSASTDTIPLRLTTTQHPALPGRDNLIALSRIPGLRIRAIGRVRVGAPRELHVLAIAPAPGETQFTMPDPWEGRVNLHYDRLAMVPSGRSRPAESEPAPPPPSPSHDLLAPLRRRVERAVLGGANTLPTHAIAELEREAAALAERSLTGAASALRDLAALAHDAARAATGSRRALDRTSFAHAWLRAALYEDAARRRLSVASW